MNEHISNNHALMVPIQLDALCLNEEQELMAPFADFTQLPHLLPSIEGDITTYQEFNPQRPYLSETALHPPFSGKAVRLEAGIHLHWSLPDALTRLRQSDAHGLRLPNVPNRWLVIRRTSDGSISQKWMIISDILWERGRTPPPEQMAGTILQRAVGEAAAHARHMGMVQTLGKNGGFTPLPDGVEYFPDLTAMGYGDPLYSAFYPNVQGIFGFCDRFSNPYWTEDAALQTRLRQTSYELYGWYDSLEKDELHLFLEKQSTEATTSQLEEAIKAAFHWETVQYIPPLEGVESPLAINTAGEIGVGGVFPGSGPLTGGGENAVIPGQMICFAKLHFSQDVAPEAPNVLSEPVEVAVGNTGTEALSAFLAEKLEIHESAGGLSNAEIVAKRLRIENQLEALHVNPSINRAGIDIGPKFEEARHTQSFRPIPAGHLWVIRSEPQDAGEEKTLDMHRHNEALDLLAPIGLGDKLHRINQLQKIYDQGQRDKETLSAQAFLEWQRYQKGAHAKDLDLNDPDPNDLLRYINRLDLEFSLTHDFLGYITASGGAWVGSSSRADAAFRRRVNSFTLPGFLGDENGAFREWLEKSKETRRPEPSIASELAGLLSGIKEIFDHRATIIQNVKGLKASKEVYTFDDLATLQRWHSGMPDDMIIPEDIEDDVEPGAIHQRVVELIALIEKLPVLSLHGSPAPRFWQPNEPSVLLAGAALEPTNRHGEDGAANNGWLQCLVSDSFAGNDFRTAQSSAITNLRSSVGRYLLQVPGIGETSTNGNPWHPLFFEWETRIDSSPGRHAADGAYPENFVVENYDLTETRSEFLQRKNSGLISPGSEYLQGRSILLPFASKRLEQEMDNYIVSRVRQYLQHRLEAGESLDPIETDLLELEALPLESKAAWINYFSNNSTTLLNHFNEDYQNQKGKAYLSESPHLTPTREIGPAPSDDTPEPTLPEQLLEFISETATDISTWFNNLGHAHIDEEAPIATVWRARTLLRELQNTGTHLQSQTLGGFNSRLLMGKPGWQLDVADPIAFRDFIGNFYSIKILVKRQNRLQLLPEAGFHPLRDGELEITRLQLVDSFGRTHPVINTRSADLRPTKVHLPERLRSTHNPHKVVLPARITQPARLDFRWLSAANEQRETDALPGSSPVCGWVLVNNFERSLMIYDSNGHALGYIDVTGQWRQAPGGIGAHWIEDIPNLAIRNMVRWIVETAHRPNFGEAFVDQFITQIEKGIQQIHPENAEQHPERTLLMGRPIALLRAQVHLELASSPAIDQSTLAFRHRMYGAPPFKAHFTEVKFPIRIGEHHQLNDGIIGYWLEGDPNGRFFSPQNLRRNPQEPLETLRAPLKKAFLLAFGNDEALWDKLVEKNWITSVLFSSNRVLVHPNPVEDLGDVREDQVKDWLEQQIRRLDILKEHLTFNQSLADPAQNVAVLMDPCGWLHCTTGILPTKSLSIPQEHYRKALKNIQVSFLTAPLISNPNQINLGLPEEAGYTWSWYQRDGSVWNHLNQQPILSKMDVVTAFEGDETLWNMLIDKEWIQPTPDSSDAAIFLEERTNNLDAPWNTPEGRAEVEQILERLSKGILPWHIDARMDPLQEIREGWLVLSPTQEGNDPV